MTDKERIQVYVNRLPKNCYDCPCNYDFDICRIADDSTDDWDVSAYGCSKKERHPNCPLKTIQSVQNQRAVEALEKVKKIVNDRLTPDKEYLEELEENGQIGKYDYYEIDTRVEFCKYLIIQIDQLIKEYGGKE